MRGCLHARQRSTLHWGLNIVVRGNHVILVVSLLLSGTTYYQLHPPDFLPILLPACLTLAGNHHFWFWRRRVRSSMELSLLAMQILTSCCPVRQSTRRTLLTPPSFLLVLLRQVLAIFRSGGGATLPLCWWQCHPSSTSVGTVGGGNWWQCGASQFTMDSENKGVLRRLWWAKNILLHLSNLFTFPNPFIVIIFPLSFQYFRIIICG